MEFILGAKAASDKEHPGTITLADAIKWAPAKEFTISSTTNNYFLSVPTQTFSGKKLGSVQETVDEFFIREQVEGTREVQFAKGEKMFLLISAPPTLLIQLNRYTYDWQTMRSLRLGHPIKVEPVVLTIHTPQGEASEKAYYEPLAVEVHQPFLSHSIEAGHYYTYIKGTEGWICHDDARPPYRADDAALDINHNGYLLNYRLVKKEMITSTKEIKNN
jgi:ubiquitin C-terminal hydrolase